MKFEKTDKSFNEQYKEFRAKKFKQIGNPIKPTFKMSIDKITNMKVLVKTGTENIYDKIQENAKNTDIYSILALCNGDGDQLKKFKPNPEDFLDVSNVPTSLYEAHKMITEATASFEKLPLQIRKEYHHNPNEYLKAYGTESFFEVLDKYVDTKKLKPKKKEEPQNPLATGTEKEGAKTE